VSQSRHPPKQAISHLQELEGQEEAKGNSEEMISSLHGEEACCKVVTTWHKINQDLRGPFFLIQENIINPSY
jgi:hypothetical protein